MDSIIHWVTQMIIFILLAAIIDLLIPANAMKKYVKLIFGLILMLIFLKPLFYLFNLDVNQSIESSLSQLYQEEKTGHSLENLTKLQKTDIQASQHAYILEQMTNQLKDLARAPLIENHQVEIADIDFLFSSKQHASYENLEEIIVFLQEATDKEGAVTIIDEVIILSDDEIEKGTEDEQKDLERIKILLKEIWEISDKKLTIKWEGGAS